MALGAYKNQEIGKDAWGTRSFLWIDGSFKMIMPEKSWETSVEATCLDDGGNMIVNTYPRKGGSLDAYFISPLRSVIASCQGCDLLRNGLPIRKGCLPGKLKIDNQGKLHYSPGLQV